jgi:peptidoglycan/LPS O-acetylase OafA/YrhL
MPAQPKSSARKLPSLDGWRAISIALVLVGHSQYTDGFPKAVWPVVYWGFDGNLGVRCFFVISGLLITWLMIRERERTGEVNLRHFYVRRALRILPVCCAFLGVLAMLQWLTPFRQQPQTWLANITFTTNFLAVESFTSGHLWSLAVEEQFYLIWPFLFGGFVARQRTWTTVRMLCVPIIVAPIVRVADFKHWFPSEIAPLFSGYSFFRYFDSLAIGCICAFLLARRRAVLDRVLVGNHNLVIASGLMLIVAPHVMNRIKGFGFLHLPFGYTAQGFGIALLILLTILRPPRWLNTAPMRGVGALSYSLYIWQQLFCSDPKWFGWNNAWWMSVAFWIPTVFAVSLVSYFGMERPLFRLRERLRG